MKENKNKITKEVKKSEEKNRTRKKKLRYNRNDIKKQIHLCTQLHVVYLSKIGIHSILLLHMVTRLALYRGGDGNAQHILHFLFEHGQFYLLLGDEAQQIRMLLLQSYQLLALQLNK